MSATRCPWSEGVNDAYLAYHDEEWGVPVWDDQRQFEFLILEGAQAGLSWATVLNKRQGFYAATWLWLMRNRFILIEEITNDGLIIGMRWHMAKAIVFRDSCQHIFAKILPDTFTAPVDQLLKLIT